MANHQFHPTPATPFRILEGNLGLLCLGKEKRLAWEKISSDTP